MENEKTVNEVEESENSKLIPNELKEKLNEKITSVMENISIIEASINNAIEDTISEMENPVTVTEITAALLNVLKKMNKKEITHLVNV